jgi:DNA-binding protein HU-beta
VREALRFTTIHPQQKGDTSMNRRELVKAVANHTGMDAKHIDQALRGVIDVVTGVVAKGEAVTLSGFAKFAKVDRAARMGRNPATGEPMRIKASKKARITPLKAFKDAVMSPSQAPKLARGVWPLAEDGARSTVTASARKATANKATANKAAAKQAATKKAAAKKATTKKAAAKKAAAKKATTKKAAAKKATTKRAAAGGR